MWTEQIKSQVLNGFNSIPKPSSIPNPSKSHKEGAAQPNAESDSSEDSAVVVKKEDSDSNAEDKTVVHTPTTSASETMEKGKDFMS